MKRSHTAPGIPTLAEALSRHSTADELKLLASVAGAPGATRKAELAAGVIRSLDGNGLKRTWERLDATGRAAVAEVVHSPDSTFPATRFRAKYGRDPEWGSLSRYNRDAKPSPLRLFFYGGGAGMTMPDDLKARLKVFVPPPQATAVKTLDELPPHYDRSYPEWTARGKERRVDHVPLTVRDGERAAPRELLSVLRLIDAGKVKVSETTRRPAAAALEEIAGVLEGGDFYPPAPPAKHSYDDNAGPMRAFAWPMLLQAGGLAQLSGSRLQLSPAGRKALAAPPPDTLRGLWRKWLGTTLLDELSRIDFIKGQGGKGGKQLTAPSARRRAIAETLAECPAQRWIAVKDFRDYQRAASHDFTISRNPWSLYICDPQYGSLGYEAWVDIADERYMWCVLFEYAATLGLLDVAYVPPAQARYDFRIIWGTDDMSFFSRYDGLCFLRINSLGAYVLGTAPVYAPPPVERRAVLRVLPNLEIVAIGKALDHSDRLALDGYAVPVSEMVWQLQPAKLLSAVEEGSSVAEVREFLQANSANALPGTVDRLLRDMEERSAQVRDRGLARLLECADPALATLIAHDTRTRRHCMQAGERHLVVPPSAEAAFRRGLRELGYLLAQEQVAPAGPARKARVERAARLSAP